MFSLDGFLKRYETDTREVVVGGRRFTLLVPGSLEKWIHSEDPLRDFPLWAKVWEASLILADHVSRLRVDATRHFLELGCGLGLVGIAAAAFGHRVTMTEFQEDALGFARANAALNLKGQEENLNIRRLDWNRPDLKGSYHIIMGSEIIYAERDFVPLERLFQTYLAPGGEVLLAEGLRKTSIGFFKQAGRTFRVRARKMALRSHARETAVLLCTMSSKH